MSGTLLGTIAGLAALDSLNPATILAVTLVLLAAPRRPAAIALATVTGAALTVFGAGAALFLVAAAAADAVGGIVVALRIVAFAAAGLAMIVAGVRRLRTRDRRPVQLPAWFTPWTALPFGALLTGADLPNAFPYFIAIERLIDARTDAASGLLVLAGYALIYVLPCLVLLVVGLITRRRTRALLERVTRRFGSGQNRRSVPVAVALVTAGIIVGTLPVWLV